MKKATNETLESVLRILYNYVYEPWDRKCTNCPYMTRGDMCQESDRKNGFCAVEKSFDVICNEIIEERNLEL